MSDYASEWPGRLFGAATGLGAAVALWLISLSWRACGPERFGPKADVGFTNPFDPMETRGGLVGMDQYCTSVLSGDLLAVLPWILGVVGGLVGYLIGDHFDKRHRGAKRSESA